MNDDNEIYMPSDDYFNDDDKRERYESFFGELTPVDVFGGFVPVDKNDKNNLQKNGKALLKRFGHDK